MRPRPWIIAALVWAPFLSVFVFASLGDTSALHITSHLLALALLVPAVVLVRKLRTAATTRTQRVCLTVLQWAVPLAIVGHSLELGIAVARLAGDGWANLDTADIWDHGPHVWAANVTVPATMVAMITTIVLAIVSGLATRRGPQPA